MIAPAPPTTPASDDQVVRTFTLITVSFCSTLVLVGGLGAFILIPDSSVSAGGMIIGAALGLMSWFGGSSQSRV